MILVVKTHKHGDCVGDSRIFNRQMITIWGVDGLLENYAAEAIFYAIFISYLSS